LLYDVKYRVAAGAVKENLSAFPEWHQGNLFACFNLPKKMGNLIYMEGALFFPQCPAYASCQLRAGRAGTRRAAHGGEGGGK